MRYNNLLLDIDGDSRGDYPAFKVIGNANGLICYAGLDDNYSKELKSEFKNYIWTISKKSSGVIEALEYLLETQ